MAFNALHQMAMKNAAYGNSFESAYGLQRATKIVGEILKLEGEITLEQIEKFISEYNDPKYLGDLDAIVALSHIITAACSNIPDFNERLNTQERLTNALKELVASFPADSKPTFAELFKLMQENQLKSREL